MRRSRVLAFLLAIIFAAALSLHAQHRGGGFRGGPAMGQHHFAPGGPVMARPQFTPHFGVQHFGFRPHPRFSNFGFGFGFPHRVFAPSLFFGSGFYGYPGYYPYLPYSLPMPERPQYNVYVLGAEQASPYWSPATLLKGPATIIIIQGNENGRVIGMGVPEAFQNDPEPLGDVARRARAQAAQAKTGQRYVLRFEK